MTLLTSRLSTLLALSLTLAAPLAAAQTSPGAPAAACAQAWDITPAHLFGLWELSLWPDGGQASAPLSRGSLQFERHPEYPGSVRGTLQRQGAGGGDASQALVSGDVLDGEFALDESADGVNIDAVWSGQPQDCGQTIRGIRRPAEGRPGQAVELHFLLKKARGWR